MTSLLALAQHLGLLWVAMEATTLATAPLLYFNRTARSLEATWKYLMIGSVGIAIALLGSLFLAYSAHLGGGEPSLLFEDLLAGAGTFSRPWLRAAFVLLLVGYGTKMGLAPLHTWKPDAYGEAPGPRRGPPRRRHDELRLPRAPARLPDRERGGRGGLRARAPRLHGPPLDRPGRRLRRAAARHQADARLLERRARGDPRPRDRPRRDRRLRRAPPRDQQRPDEGGPLPLGRATSTAPTGARTSTRSRAPSRASRSPGASSSSASSRSPARRRSARSSASSRS